MIRPSPCAAPVTICILFVAAALLTSPNAQAETIDRIAAVINDEVITFNDFRREVALHLLVEAETRQKAPIPLSEFDTSPQREALIKKYLDDILNLRLFSHRAVEIKADVTDEMVNATVLNNGSEQQVAASLAAYGIELDDFKKFMKRRLQAEFVSRAEIERQATVKQNDIEVCARKAVPEGEQTVRLTIREIRVRVPEYNAALSEGAATNQALYQNFFLAINNARFSFAATIQAMIISGEATFEEMARTYSAAPNRHRDGLVDQPFSRGDLSPEFASVYAPVFDLPAGTGPESVSVPLRVAFGYHIIRVEGREEGSNPRWNTKLRECQLELLRAERMKLLEGWFVTQRARHYVQVRLFDELAGP